MRIILYRVEYRTHQHVPGYNIVEYHHMMIPQHNVLVFQSKEYVFYFSQIILSAAGQNLREFFWTTRVAKYCYYLLARVVLGSS